MQIDGYVDLVAIGAGGNAHVYKAHDVGGSDVAVKVLHGGGDEAIARRFTREVGLMGAVVDIDGLVPILDSGITASGDPFLVMPLYRGGSLNDELTAAPLSWFRAASLLRTTAVALAKAHDRRILHLDVKPANILLDDDGLPWLSDFGIAEVVGSTASMSGAMMTPAYTPPERLRDVKPSTLTDVYGLGATLYALLAGAAPYATTTGRPNPAAVMMSVLNDPVPVDRLPADVPSDLIELIELAMAKDPGVRLGSVEDVAHRLDDVLVSHGYEPGAIGELGDATIMGPSSLRDLQPSTTAPTPGDVAASSQSVAPVDLDATVAAPSESDRLGDVEDPSPGSPNRWIRPLAAAVIVAGALAAAGYAWFGLGGADVSTAATSPSADRSAPTSSTTIDPSLAGSTVRVLSNAASQPALEEFAARFLDTTGISVQVTSTANVELFERTIDGDSPPDIVLTSDIGDAEHRCSSGSFVPVDEDFDQVLRTQHRDGLVLRGGGNVCGAALSATPTFVIWFSPTAMEDSSYEVPTTWDDLQVVSEVMIGDGRTPWCINLANDGPVGFPGVQWIDNLLIRSLSVEAYDALYSGELAWSDPAVAAVFTQFDELLTDELVDGGRTRLVRTNVGPATVDPLTGANPSCYFHAAHTGFAGIFEFHDNSLVEGVDYDFLSFPPLDESESDRQLVGSQFAAATADRPEVLAVLEHVLSLEGQETLVELGVPVANQHIDLGLHPEGTSRRLAGSVRGADSVRVSGTVRLSPETVERWRVLMIELVDGTSTVEEVLAALDEAVAQEDGA